MKAQRNARASYFIFDVLKQLINESLINGSNGLMCFIQVFVLQKKRLIRVIDHLINRMVMPIKNQFVLLL
jgi:hypothetical protein